MWRSSLLLLAGSAAAATDDRFYGNSGLEYNSEVSGIDNHASAGLCKNREFVSANATNPSCKQAYHLECLHDQMVFKIYKPYLEDLRGLSSADVYFNTIANSANLGYNTEGCDTLNLTTSTDAEGDELYEYRFQLDSTCGTSSNGTFSGSTETSTWTYSNRLTLNTTNYKDIRAVPFECSYTTNYTIRNVEGYLYKFIDLQIKDAGSFELALTSYASENVSLTEPILSTEEVIFEVTSTSTDDTTRKVFIERCYLTEFDPTSYTGLTEVDVITNGCSAQSDTIIDNNYKTNDGQMAKFRSKIFSVEQNFEQAYVTCDIRFCDDTSCTDPACSVGLERKRRSIPDHVYHAPLEVHPHHMTRARRDVRRHTLSSINESLRVSFGMFTQSMVLAPIKQ